MEDAVTRTHAQQLVAAALYVGSRVVGDLMRRLLTHPNRVELRADGLPHTPENAERLRSLAAQVARRTLGEPPAAVVVAPDPRGGWRVHLAFAEQRPPLKPYELTDVQAGWERAKERAFGRDTRVPTMEEIRAREQDVERVSTALRQAQGRLFREPSAETRGVFAATLNRMQVAVDALRHALRQADPVRFDRPLHHDRLDLLVALRGDARLTLVERDTAVRDLLARAAALRDSADLQVTLQPTREREVWRALVAFNFRNTLERGPQHLNPASFEERVLAEGPSLPALDVATGSGAALARVTLAAVSAVRDAARAAGTQAVELDPPAALRDHDSPTRAHARLEPS